MSKKGYPESLNCWLKNFPRYIKIIFGKEIENLNSPWGNGSVLLLERIGFDPPDTNPVVGVIPPNVKVTYSNNGTDLDWIFKIGMYGWGTFFALLDDSNYYVLIEKFLEFESTYFPLKKFRYREIFRTEISKAISIENVDIPVKIIDQPPISPPPPSGGGSSYGEQNLDLLNHAHIAGNLIQAYWDLWEINRLISIQVLAYRASSLDVTGWRQLLGTTSWNGLLVQFWTNAGILKVTFSRTTVLCYDFNIEEGPYNCTYIQETIAAFTWTSLKINGLNKLQVLLTRA